MTTRKTRILYLIGGRRIGGTETHVRRLAAAIGDEYDCLVCCLDPSPEYGRSLADVGVEYVDLRLPSLTRPQAFGRIAAFERVARRFQPDIVHSYSFGGDVLGSFLRGRGVEMTFITSRRGEDANRRHQLARRLINRLSDRIVCVSSEVARFVERTERPSPALLEVIPNGVPMTLGVRRDDRSRAVVRFGTLGTVKPIKGTDLLVEAFLKLGADVRAELVIAGLVDRPWAEELKNRASVDDRIEFIGRASEPDTFLAGLDVFVLPSRSEGMSNALLEAMALGLPCVTTDVGSNRSLVQPAHHAPAGIVCAPTSDALFAAMNRLSQDPVARAQYGAAAAAIVKDGYTADAMVGRYHGLYRTVMRSDLSAAGGYLTSSL